MNGGALCKGRVELRRKFPFGCAKFDVPLQHLMGELEMEIGQVSLGLQRKEKASLEK